MTGPKSLPSEIEATAQDQLQEIVEELKRVERRLRAVHQSLAAPADAEATEEAEDARDISTEIRSVIECVLTDSLGPAARDLQAASLYGAGARLK